MVPRGIGYPDCSRPLMLQWQQILKFKEYSFQEVSKTARQQQYIKLTREQKTSTCKPLNFMLTKSSITTSFTLEPWCYQEFVMAKVITMCGTVRLNSGFIYVDHRRREFFRQEIRLLIGMLKNIPLQWEVTPVVRQRLVITQVITL